MATNCFKKRKSFQKNSTRVFELLPENFDLNEIKWLKDFFLVKSTIILTPEQSLELRSRKSGKNVVLASKLSNFIHFKTTWSVKITNRTYTVFKITSRPLKCFGRKTYTSREYLMLDDGQFLINSTNKTYERLQYFTEGIANGSNILGNITLSEKYIPTSCDLPWTVLPPVIFTIYSNLSVYDNKTDKMYYYGRYDILANNSVQICISKDEEKTKQNWTLVNDMVLGWVTLVCFMLSILSLVILFITYIIFPELRTLQGKNLTNLAVTLLMSAIFWII